MRLMSLSQGRGSIIFGRLISMAATGKFDFVIATISPDNATDGSADTVVTITGGLFTVTSKVWYNGVLKATTFLGSNSLQFTVTAAELTSPGYYNVQVIDSVDPTLTSNIKLFGVNYKDPTLTLISPTFAFFSEGPLALSATGTNFYTAKTVGYANSIAESTNVTSTTAATITVANSELMAVGNVLIDMRNPLPGGGISATQTLQVRYRAPTATSLSPSSSLVNVGIINVDVNGTNFYNGPSVVFLDGVQVTTTWISATKLRFQLDTSIAGGHSVYVSTPTTGGGGGVTSTLSFSVGFPLPVLTSISPTKVRWNDPLTTITLNGSGYGASTVARLNGTNQTTSTGGAPTAVTFDFTPSTVADYTIDCTNPTTGGGGGTSASKTLSAVPVITAISPNTGIQYDPPTVSATVTGSGFTASTVVEINGIDCPTTFVNSTTVTITVPGTVSISPGALTVRVKRATGAATSIDSVTYTVALYDPLVTATGNYASYDADHVVLDPIPQNPNDILQVDDIVSATYPFKNQSNIGSNPPLIASDSGINNYASVDFNGTGDVLGNFAPSVNPLVTTLFPASDWTMVLIARVRSSSTNDTTLPYNNSQIVASDSNPGVRVGVAVLNNAGAYSICFWMSDGSLKQVTSTNVTVGAWHYIVVKKSGTTLSISINNETFINQTGVGNVSATTQRVRLGKSYEGANKFFDGRFRALIFGQWTSDDIARGYNYCKFRLGMPI